MNQGRRLDYRIKSLEYDSEVKLLKGFMLNRPQWYPDFKEWVDGKCVPRIDSGEYFPFLLFDKKDLVGDVIYRYLDNNSLGGGSVSNSIIEIKNFRIDEKYHNQYWGKVLLRQLEMVANGKEIITDVTEHNLPALDFFLRNGFQITGKEQLYKEGQFEYLLRKQ